MLTSLILPIILTTVALFFASFLSWMVLPFHKQDWVKLSNEDEFLDAARGLELQPGSYMFPGYSSAEEMNSEGYKAKFSKGPVGVMTVFQGVSMGRNLGLTVVYFLCCNICLAYLSGLALKPGDEFLAVFRFFATAGLMTFLAAILQHAIWFHNRVVGHVLESVIYAVIAGLIFALMWPSA